MAVVDYSILEASHFNEIKTFENQQKSIDTDLLIGIGNIFVKHDIHNRFAAEILHRHLTLEEGMLLLHSEQEDDGTKMEVCRVASRSGLDESQLTGLSVSWVLLISGCSFFLNEHNLIQPYEYQIGTTTPIDEPFGLEMRDYLVKHELQDRISIVLRSENKTCEFMLPEQDGTIRVPVDQVTDEDLEGCELFTTEFYFDEKGGFLKCSGGTAHAAMVNGAHKVFVTSKLRKKASD
jgi:hypothetical protein